MAGNESSPALAVIADASESFATDSSTSQLALDPAITGPSAETGGHASQTLSFANVFHPQLPQSIVHKILWHIMELPKDESGNPIRQKGDRYEGWEIGCEYAGIFASKLAEQNVFSALMSAPGGPAALHVGIVYTDHPTTRDNEVLDYEGHFLGISWRAEWIGRKVPLVVPRAMHHFTTVYLDCRWDVLKSFRTIEQVESFVGELESVILSFTHITKLHLSIRIPVPDLGFMRKSAHTSERFPEWDAENCKDLFYPLAKVVCVKSLAIVDGMWEWRWEKGRVWSVAVGWKKSWVPH